MSINIIEGANSISAAALHAMDMTGIETLLGPIGASPLDMEPISSGLGVISTRVSADDGYTLFILPPLFWTTRKWGQFVLVALLNLIPLYKEDSTNMVG